MSNFDRAVKALADMTAEEREECVGMWCECTTGHSEHLAVLLNDSGLIIFPHLLKSGTLEIGLITPRFDLPRAWTPDGQPVEMVKEYGIFYTLRDGGEEVCFVHDDPLSVEPAVKHLEKSLRRGTITKITRKTQWVTEWEEVPEPQRTNGMVNPYV